MRSKGAPVRHRCPCLMLSPAQCVERHEQGAMPEADSELQLCCVPGSTLNHITANLGLCQWRQVPQHLPCLCSLPDAWHLGHSCSVGSLPTLENERGCLDSGFLQMVLLPRPSKGAVWETGALLSFSQGWGVFWVPVLSPLPSWSDFVGHQ